MIIGAQGFTIRDYAQNEADFRETAKKLHDIGYKTLQVSAFGDIDPHIIREICDENGLSIIITHTNPQLILENTEKVIENHRIFGTNHVGIGMMPQKYTGSLEGMRAFLKDFGPAADKLAQAQHVFDALRTFDATDVPAIWAQCPDSAGLGLAVGNRLKMAAGFHTEEADGTFAFGITGGTGDGKFSPNATCTRAQAVTFLYRASGSPAVSDKAEFSDVSTTAFYADAVAWAAKKGITTGIGGGLFGSGNDCTRGQIVTFLWRCKK